MPGLKQEGIAYELGEDWNQKKISLLESKEVVDKALLDQVAKVLKVTPEIIKNFEAEKAIFSIQNNFEGSNNQGTNLNYQPTFNAFDKYAETVDKLKRLNEESKQLYKRIVQTEKERRMICCNSY